MVRYRHVVLARNSQAYEFWEKKDFKRLDQHLKELDQKQTEDAKRYRKEN